MRAFIYSLVVFAISASPVWAEARLIDGGTPKLHDVRSVSNEHFEDFYTRQLAYAKQRLEFRQDLEARREIFAIPRLEAVENYRRNLAAFNAKRTDWRGLD